jgi:hypothetical protein
VPARDAMRVVRMWLILHRELSDEKSSCMKHEKAAGATYVPVAHQYNTHTLATYGQ